MPKRNTKRNTILPLKSEGITSAFEWIRVKHKCLFDQWCATCMLKYIMWLYATQINYFFIMRIIWRYASIYGYNLCELSGFLYHKILTYCAEIFLTKCFNNCALRTISNIRSIDGQWQMAVYLWIWLPSLLNTIWECTEGNWAVESLRAAWKNCESFEKLARSNFKLEQPFIQPVHNSKVNCWIIQHQKF